MDAKWLEEPNCPGTWVKCYVCTDKECGEPHVAVEEVVLLPDDFEDFDWEEWTPGSLWTKAPDFDSFPSSNRTGQRPPKATI